MTAYVLIRSQPCYRRDAFIAGLENQGHDVCLQPDRPKPDDVLVIWNRYGAYHRMACEFEGVGAQVLVAENGYLGREWGGEYWYAISRNWHNGGGTWATYGPQRWDALNVPLEPWREGEYILVLEQRGIGSTPVRQPDEWAQHVRDTIQSDLPIRWRKHPGEDNRNPLENDLRHAAAVVTWASGGGIKALLAGVPVFYGYPRWIGGSAASRFTGDVTRPSRPDRLPMFRNLAWAMWRLDEIENGEPFRHLLRETKQAQGDASSASVCDGVRRPA